MARLRVGVIFGGRSVEHDVSILTAHQVMAVLGERHEVVPVYITREGRWLTSPELNDLDVYRTQRWDAVGQEAFVAPIAGFGGLLATGGRLRGPRKIPLDVVVPATHGTFGEDGTLQGLLELAAIPFTGSGVVGSAVGMDKIAMKSAFAAAGLPIPQHVVVDAAELDAAPDTVVEKVERDLGFPVFVKPAALGSSVGIGKAGDPASLRTAIEVARSYDPRVIVEQAMQGCIEVNCSVLGGPGHPPVASVCEQPVASEAFLTFSDKYLQGGKRAKPATSARLPKSGGMAAQERRIPAPLPDALTKQVQENAIAAFTAVGASGVARIDTFVKVSSGETWVNEINTIPGSFSFYLWEPSGVSFPDLMDRLIDMAVARQRQRSQLTYTFGSALLGSALLGSALLGSALLGSASLRGDALKSSRAPRAPEGTHRG